MQNAPAGILDARREGHFMFTVPRIVPSDAES
jgi:hypothetical protein